MTGRIGFQLATILLITTTVGWKADQRRQNEIELTASRDERRRVAKLAQTSIAAASTPATIH